MSWTLAKAKGVKDTAKKLNVLIRNCESNNIIKSFLFVEFLKV